MSSIVRIGLNKVLINSTSKCLVAKINIQSVRTITSRLDELPPKPKPYNYNEKYYTMFHYMYDKTTSRFDENTKLIVVEGPVASGKSKFAKDLAKSFGMLYLPEANLDMNYINDYGYDIKKLDALLPPDCRSFDIMDFLRNPQHKLVARMQIQQFIVRFSQYLDALAHIFSTGQGIVLDRSVYSDFVFAEAMFKHGYISKPAYKKYYEFRDNTLQELLRPHLVIYLDVPVPKIMENIKKRNISYEVNSPVLSKEYLEVMEKHYKQNYLKEISKHAELLVYDWSVEGDMEIVMEDIESIKFQRNDIHDPKLADWDLREEEDWAVRRYDYADRKEELLAFCNIPCFEVPELIVEALDADTYFRVLKEAPGGRYETGYNSKMGDGGWFLKLGVPKRRTLPLRERRAC